MCKAPKPPAPKEPEKPQFLRNRYLDAAIGQSGVVNALRSGRSSLRIPLSPPSGTGGDAPVADSVDPQVMPDPTPTRPAPTPVRIPYGRRRAGGYQVR